MKNKILANEQQLDFPLNCAGIRKTLILLRSVNHKLRQRMIEIIGQGKKIVVTDICNELNLDQSAVSQHLAVLRQAGVVKTERQGKYIFYFLAHLDGKNRMNSIGMSRFSLTGNPLF